MKNIVDIKLALTGFIVILLAIVGIYFFLALGITVKIFSFVGFAAIVAATKTR